MSIERMREDDEWRGGAHRVMLRNVWAGGRAVQCTGLENRQTLTGLVGSNPTLPACACGGDRPRVGMIALFFVDVGRRASAPALGMDQGRPRGPRQRVPNTLRSKMLR